MLHRERTKCETKVGQLASKVTISRHFNQEPYIYTLGCFTCDMDSKTRVYYTRVSLSITALRPIPKT